MNEYPKIQTVFKRNPDTRMKTLLEGQYSLPEFEYLARNRWIFTEKVDGTNIRILWNGTNIAFGGKTANAQIPAILLNVLNDTFLPQRDTFVAKFPDPVCLYGEGYGANIQSGGVYRRDQSFVLFDVQVGSWWLQDDDVSDVAKTFGLDRVPIIDQGPLSAMIDMVANGFKSAWGDFMAEGIVARPAMQLFNRKGDRIITKIKYKDFRH